MQIGPQLGSRGYWLTVFGLIAALIMWVTGIVLYPGAKESFSYWGLGTGIGAALALLFAPEAAKKIFGEWPARAKDQSTIAEQTRAQNGTPPEPPLPGGPQ